MTKADELRPGLKGETEIVVGTRDTAPHVGSGKIKVLATPVGMRVKARAELTKIDGRKLTFRVSAEDEKDLIGEGLHERIIVNVERFDKRTQEKADSCR